MGQRTVFRLQNAPYMRVENELSVSKVPHMLNLKDLSGRSGGGATEVKGREDVGVCRERESGVNS